MDAKELNQKQPDELRRLVNELSAQLRDLRFKIATRQWSKVRAIRVVKKDIARIRTVLHNTSQTR